MNWLIIVLMVVVVAFLVAWIYDYVKYGRAASAAANGFVDTSAPPQASKDE